MSHWMVRAMAATVLVAGVVLAAAGGASAAPAVRQFPVTSASGAAIGQAAATQGGSCNAFSGAYQLPGSNGVVPAAYSDASLVVPACGPLPGTGGGPDVHPYPGSLATPGYQCVEFSERYLYYKYGATMGISTNGDQVVAHYRAKYPSLFSVVANGTANEAPVQGDVLSFSTVSTFNSGSGGHTGVVEASSVNSSGNGSITIVEENAVSSGVQVLSVSNWTVNYSGFPYIEWLHSQAAQTAPTVPAVTTPDGHIQLFWVSNGVVEQNWYSPATGAVGNWTSPVPMQNGVQAAGNPAIVKRAGQQVIDVFTRSTDGQIRETWYNWGNGTWGGWIPISGSAFTGDPQALATPDGHEQIFADDNGVIKQNWFAPAGGAIGNWVTI